MTKLTKSSSFWISALPLFLAILIDSMGLGLIIPTLNTLMTNNHSGFFLHPVTVGTRNILFGLVMCLFMLCWFFGAAYLGDLSDAIGRKKSLLLSLMGNLAGYLISAVSVGLHSFTLLLMGRMLAGFTAGSQSIAQAAVIDISSPDTKARNIGWILLASSIGFILGPIIGALLSNSSLYQGFTLAMPMYFAAFMAFLNCVLLVFLFKETFEPKKDLHFQFHQAVEIFVSAFKHPTVKYLAFIFFIMMLGWGSYYSFIALYLAENYHLNNTAINIFMALMASGFGIGFGLIVNYVSHHYSLKQVSAIFLVIAGIIMLVSVILKGVIFSWLSVFPIGICIAVPYSMILTLFSNQIDENSQGWIMGITNAIGAMAFALTSIFSALLANVYVSLPIAAGGICLSLSGICLYSLKNKIK